MNKLLLLIAVTLYPVLSIAQTANYINAAHSKVQQMHNSQMKTNNQIWENNLLRQGASARMSSDLQMVSYMVELKDSTKLALSSRIQFDNQNNSYILVQHVTNKMNQFESLQQEVIYPSNTNSIVRLSERGHIIAKGIPFEQHWIFPLVKGKITGYGLIPVQGIPSAEHFKYLQNGDGPILPYSHNLLQEMLGNNDKAIKLASYDKVHEAIVKYNKTITK